ncbi:MAG: hypothetical protein UV38_C0002G0022 [candidate division TM6 bacterium GW2011_GWE2_42_60]|nr:MAG: hypothetical protein UV38_C0002G0022 [candidate division TM6 bacterium GW2011_GWE2_42_60]
MFTRSITMVACLGLMFCESTLFSGAKEAGKVLAEESFLAEPVAAKNVKKQKRTMTTMRQDVAEEIESLLHTSSDLIAELAQSQKEFMEQLRHIAENEPALSRSELELLSARTKRVAEELNNCKIICRKK